MQMSYVIREQKTKYNAKANKEVHIPPGQIYNVEMQIAKARHNDKDEEEKISSPWLAYANGRESIDKHAKGLCFAHSLLKVEGDKITIPILNADLKKTRTLKTNDMTIMIHKVDVRYERQLPERMEEPDFSNIPDLADNKSDSYKKRASTN